MMKKGDQIKLVVPMTRTDGLYLTMDRGTFEGEGVRGTFASTVGSTAFVVNIKHDDGTIETYEVRAQALVEAILEARS